jgi:DNA-binding MarR family transcriptional regulator
MQRILLATGNLGATALLEGPSKWIGQFAVPIPLDLFRHGRQQITRLVKIQSGLLKDPPNTNFSNYMGEKTLSGERHSTLSVRHEKEDDVNPQDNLRLWRLFFAARSSMSRVRDLELAAIGVTREQSGALFLLAGRGKSTISEMANAWCRQRNSVSTLMARMEKQGLVKRVKIPKHKDLEVYITPLGREMHNRVLSTGQVFDTVFTQFSEEDRRDFAQYLRMVLSGSQAILDAKNRKSLREDDSTSKSSITALD